MFLGTNCDRKHKILRLIIIVIYYYLLFSVPTEVKIPWIENVSYNNYWHDQMNDASLVNLLKLSHARIELKRCYSRWNSKIMFK